MWIQKIITKVMLAVVSSFKSKDKLVIVIKDQKDDDKHTIVKTLYCEGNLVETLKDTAITYLK